MNRTKEWLFDTNHPLRFAIVSLLIGLANAYEAKYIDNPEGVWYIVSMLFAAAGVVGFVAFLAVAVYELFSPADQ